MAINSKADAIRGIYKSKDLISKQTYLEKCKEILINTHNGMVQYSGDTCILAAVQGDESRNAIYYNNKLAKNTSTDLSGMDIFKVIIDPEYFEKVLHSTFPSDFSDIEFIEVLVAVK